MISKKNEVYIGAKNKKSLYDLTIPSQGSKELVIFVHGYKGYKDWGAWNLVEDHFVSKGFAFAKLNLSHNGGTIHEPIDFPDLEAFGQNCYSFEVTDVVRFIQLVSGPFEKIHLIGHSRGGGIVVLAGNQAKVNSITTWAGISSIESRFPLPGSQEDIQWKEKGVRYVLNGRTKQEMPHYYSMMEDFLNNKESLRIETAAKGFKGAIFHIHGDQDQAVNIAEGEALANWSKGNLFVVKNGDHTFGSKHPWTEDDMPDNLKQVVHETLNFIKNV